MPYGWTTTRISDICKTNQQTYSMSEKWPFVNYLDTGSLTENRISDIQHIVIGKDALPSRARRKIAVNDILYSTVRPNQRHYGIIKEPLQNMLVSTGFAVITTDKTKADSDFLYYYLSQNDIVDGLHAIGEQSVSAYPSIKASDIENMEMLLPPLSEQIEIGRILRALDDKIANNAKINHHLEQMAQAIFKSWFVDFEPFADGKFIDSELGEIPAGWRVGILDECTDFFNGYAFKSKELLNSDTGNCYHVFKMGHIQKGGGFNANGTKSWIKRSECQSLGRYVLQRGDLLMCMTDMKGNVALLGHTALMAENDKYIVNQRVGLLRANGRFGIDYPFLYIITNYKEFLENLRGRANSGVQVNLSTAEIKASKFVLAPESINKQFNDIVKPMFQTIMDNQLESTCLATLRDTLLPRLMSGELSVADLADAK